MSLPVGMLRVNNMSDLCVRAPPSGLLTTIFSEILLIFSE